MMAWWHCSILKVGRSWLNSKNSLYVCLIVMSYIQRQRPGKTWWDTGQASEARSCVVYFCPCVYFVNTYIFMRLYAFLSFSNVSLGASESRQLCHCGCTFTHPASLECLTTVCWRITISCTHRTLARNKVGRTRRNGGCLERIMCDSRCDFVSIVSFFCCLVRDYCLPLAKFFPAVFFYI